MAHHKCTERERLRPFHRQSDAASVDAAATDIDHGHHGHPELAHFVQKYNAVLLDTTCFQQKRKALTADNKKLRAVLKAYLDGITVSNHTVDEANTLFVVNHCTNTVHAKRAQQHQAVVEGNHVVNAYQRQLH